MPWIGFFLCGVRQLARDSQERTVRLAELQHQLRNDLRDEGRPNSVVRLAEQLFAIPLLTAARVESMIGVTRPTAQAAIDTLVERGDLTETTGRAHADASMKHERSPKRCTDRWTSNRRPSTLSFPSTEHTPKGSQRLRSRPEPVVLASLPSRSTRPQPALNPELAVHLRPSSGRLRNHAAR